MIVTCNVMNAFVDVDPKSTQHVQQAYKPTCIHSYVVASTPRDGMWPRTVIWPVTPIPQLYQKGALYLINTDNY